MDGGVVTACACPSINLSVTPVSGGAAPAG